MSENNHPAGHIPSTGAALAMTAAETLANNAATHQSAPAQTANAVQDAVSKAATAIVGDLVLQQAKVELLIVLHVNNTSFQLKALADTRKSTVIRQGGRELTANLYSPFHRHNPNKSKSMPSGLVRNALPTIFETVSQFNGLNLVVAGTEAQQRLEDAAKAIASQIRRSLIIGAGEVVATLAENQQPVAMRDLVQVQHWVNPAAEDEEEPAPTIMLALHIHAGALYDAEDPGTWIRQQSSLLETFSQAYQNARFKIAFAIGAEALVQGTAIHLLNFLSEDENTIPYGRAALANSPWAPQDLNKVLWDSDFLFLKNPGAQLSDPAAAATDTE